eukprot:NODE_2159_length_503_cov_94.002203_g1763_i0.p3 GENE.NODE_2159_length_503_cov_94.002203_g1763_i0~~NODE_2159_length_503_cov_94.002203_g1763_i0.p3  ORF type:complete len:53 (+),score=22.73 NODE_2159_length_503_cov_94.002203_g1763_i0:32-160(+)
MGKNYHYSGGYLGVGMETETFWDFKDYVPPQAYQLPDICKKL